MTDTTDRRTIHVADADPAVLKGFAAHCRGLGVGTVAHTTGERLLESPDLPGAACIVLDYRLPGMTGVEVFHALRARGHQMPVMMVTGYADVALAVDLMKQGLFDFIRKPVRKCDLLDALGRALEFDARRRHRRIVRDCAMHKWRRLTDREQAVARLILEGMVSKQIAIALSISPRTVEAHRSNVMHKTGMESVPELMRLAMRAGAIEPEYVMADRRESHAGRVPRSSK